MNINIYDKFIHGVERVGIPTVMVAVLIWFSYVAVNRMEKLQIQSSYVQEQIVQNQSNLIKAIDNNTSVINELKLEIPLLIQASQNRQQQ